MLVSDHHNELQAVSLLLSLTLHTPLQLQYPHSSLGRLLRHKPTPIHPTHSKSCNGSRFPLRPHSVLQDLIPVTSGLSAPSFLATPASLLSHNAPGSLRALHLPFLLPVIDPLLKTAKPYYWHFSFLHCSPFYVSPSDNYVLCLFICLLALYPFCQNVSSRRTEILLLFCLLLCPRTQDVIWHRTSAQFTFVSEGRS